MYTVYCVTLTDLNTVTGNHRQDTGSRLHKIKTSKLCNSSMWPCQKKKSPRNNNLANFLTIFSRSYDFPRQEIFHNLGKLIVRFYNFGRMPAGDHKSFSNPIDWSILCLILNSCFKECCLRKLLYLCIQCIQRSRKQAI